MSDKTIFKYTPKRQKPLAPACLAWISTLLYVILFGMAVLIAYVLGSYFLKVSEMRIDLLILAICVSGASLVLLIFFNNAFEWFYNIKMTFTSEYIDYTFDEIISMLGHTGIKDRVTKLTGYKVRKNSIVLFGDIEHHEPIGKPELRHKLVIEKSFEDYDEMITMLDAFKEKTANE